MKGLIRRANASDIAALVALRAQMFDDMGVAASDGPWIENCRAWFQRSLDDPDVLVLVAEADGGVLACGMAELAHGAPAPTCPSGRTARISNVVTHPDARGRGLGTDVMKALLDWASQVADRAELHASNDGHALYRRLGFTDTALPAMRLPLL